MRTSQPPRKTFVDYAAIAVCPALIMLLVGSLIFYLLAVGYAGSHLGELRWIFFWFVLAMVLVSRIAIERGSEYAALYGLCLAAATAFMLFKYMALSLLALGLLGLIWWATNKLTWDCTVIDEEQDASGEGLLQAAKLDPHRSSRSKEALDNGVTNGTQRNLSLLTPAPAVKGGVQIHSRKKPAKVHWWDRAPARRPAAFSQPHAPGLWVIYFSLGALPLFGLGQGLNAKQDVGTRHYAFCLLAIYLAAALGLLLITSFLGLRRYLRQRYLQMPPAMAATWLTTGTMIGSAILLACLLLPRPSAHWSLTAMINRIGDPVPKHAQQQDASSKVQGEMRGGEAKPDGEKSGPGDTAQSNTSAGGTAKDGAPTPPSEQMTNGNPSNQSVSESAPPGGTNGPGKTETTGQKAGRTERSKAAQKTPGEGESAQAARRPPAISLRTPLNLLRLAIYAALVALGFFVVIKYREPLGRVLLEFWRALQQFWQGLFAREAKPLARDEAAIAASPRRPFAALINPFVSGAATQMALEDLIVQSFEGLEAWAEEHQCGRAPDQTPFEFADRVAVEVPDLAHEAEQVTRLYVQVAYAKAAVLPACRTMLEILWSKMTQGLR